MNIRNFWRRHKFVAVYLICFVGGSLFLAGLWVAGVRVNLTPSLPKGIYRLTDEPARKGDFICFCLASDNPFSRAAKERGYLGRGYCPSGLKPLLKKLAGLPGDQIVIAPDGLILNGEPLANTARSEIDSYGREVPPSLLTEGRIPDGLGLVLSQEHAGSFDSRYFGLIPLARLKKAKPIFLF